MAVAILVASQAILQYVGIPGGMSIVLTKLFYSARVRTLVFNRVLAAVLQSLGPGLVVVSVEDLLVALVVHAQQRATNAVGPTITLAIAKRRP